MYSSDTLGLSTPRVIVSDKSGVSKSVLNQDWITDIKIPGNNGSTRSSDQNREFVCNNHIYTISLSVYYVPVCPCRHMFRYMNISPYPIVRIPYEHCFMHKTNPLHSCPGAYDLVGGSEGEVVQVLMQRVSGGLGTRVWGFVDQH